jgi:hypothetical protein
LLAISTRRSSLRAISRSTRKAKASRRLSWRLAASSNRVSSWSRIAVSFSRVKASSTRACSTVMPSLHRLPARTRPTAAIAPVPARPSGWARCRAPAARRRRRHGSAPGRGCADGGLGVHRHLLAAVADGDAALRHNDLHTLADQPPRHAVAVAVDLDRAIGLHPAHQFAQLTERRATVELLQCRGLFALEAQQRCFAGGAVNPAVGDFAHPPLQMRLKRCPACQVMAGNGIALDVADAAFVFALGARPIRRTGPGPEPPVLRKGVQPRAKPYLAGARVVVIDQRPWVVEQHLPRHSAKALERPLQAVKPGRLPLVPKGLYIGPPRITQRCHEQMHPHCGAPDRHDRGSEVDLQLLPGRRLKPHAGPRLGPQRLPHWRHRPFHCAQRHRPCSRRRS